MSNSTDAKEASCDEFDVRTPGGTQVPKVSIKFVQCVWLGDENTMVNSSSPTMTNTYIWYNTTVYYTLTL